MNPTDELSTFAFRLGQARRMRGLSLRDLSQTLDGIVTHAALHKYEQGAMMPDGPVLVGLCKALGQKPDFFYRPQAVSLAEVEFRKRASLKVKDEQAVKEKAADFFERYLEVEDILGVGGEFENPLSNPVINDDEDVERAADELRAAWKLGVDPLPAVVPLLEEHHIKVFEVADAPDEFEGFSGRAGEVRVIALNKNRPPDRKRLTSLHELGHLILAFNKRFEPDEIEKLCHAFAAAVLIPRSVFSEVFGGRRKHSTKQELVAIKERWGLSCSAIMMRAARLGLIAPSSLKRFHMLWREWGYAKIEPGRWGGTENASRFMALVHRAAAEGAVSISKGAYLAGQSLASFRSELQPVP